MDFVLNAGDSSFWVTADGRSPTIRMRGAPLRLAHYGGRFYEVYAEDDDRSFENALLVGEQLYRRDLITNDSAPVFSDSVIPRLAARYASAHPDEQPLGPNDEEPDDASTSATTEVDVLDVYGPFLSYEYRSDIHLPSRSASHVTRHGVLDLRTGQNLRLADLFGASAAAQLARTARRSYESARDSVLRARAARGVRGRRAAQAIARLRFDANSFALAAVNGQPAVTFAIPATGESAVDAVELEPVPATNVSWWSPVAPEVPSEEDSISDHWTRGRYRVIARYDTTGTVARLAIGDSTGREWNVGTVAGPLRRIDWLDRPAVDSVTRSALTRAFNEAARYDESARVAILATHLFHLATFCPCAP